MKSSTRRMPKTRARSRSQAKARKISTKPLKAVIITNDLELEEQARQLCKQLEKRQSRGLLNHLRTVELQCIGSPNNGESALCATEAARADVVLTYLDPAGYLPLYWKEWFQNWANYRHKPGVFLGHIAAPMAGSRLPVYEDISSEELTAFYQEVATMGQMEYIAVTAETEAELDWSNFQRSMAPAESEEQVILA